MDRSDTLTTPKRPKRSHPTSSHVVIRFENGESIRIARIHLKHFKLISEYLEAEEEEEMMEETDSAETPSPTPTTEAFDEIGGDASDDSDFEVEKEEEEEKPTESNEKEEEEDVMMMMKGLTKETFCELVRFSRDLTTVETRLNGRRLPVPCGPFFSEPFGKRNSAAHLPRVAGNLATSVERLELRRLAELTRWADCLGFETFVELAILRETLACVALTPELIMMRGKRMSDEDD